MIQLISKTDESCEVPEDEKLLTFGLKEIKKVKQRNDIRINGLQYQVTDLPIHFLHKSHPPARQGLALGRVLTFDQSNE